MKMKLPNLKQNMQILIWPTCYNSKINFHAMINDTSQFTKTLLPRYSSIRQLGFRNVLFGKLVPVSPNNISKKCSFQSIHYTQDNNTFVEEFNP